MKNEKRFGLIGFPLVHSQSPFIHERLFEIMKSDYSYSLFEISEQELVADFNNELKNLSGFNVTIPHKINIISCLDELSERAALYGSVNTVKIENGIAKGYNTDCIGFLRALGMADIRLAGSVLILGCGGVARTFAFESAIAGADVTLGIREKSREKAELLKAEIKDRLGREIKIETLDNIYAPYDLIINATPVGMYPSTDKSPVSEELVKKAGAVYDAVYNPLETELLRYAKKAKIKYSNGLSMLVCQAAAAEEIWNGFEFGDDDITQIIALTEEELKK